MKSYQFRRCAAALTALSLCLASAVSAVFPAKSEILLTASAADDMQILTDKINALRAEKNLSPVVLNADACEASAVRAAELAQKVSHERPDGRDSFTVLEEKNIYYTKAAENIAVTSEKDPEAAFAQWLNSESNLENMLGEDFEYLGAACAYDAEDLQTPYHWQIFLFTGQVPGISQEIPADYAQTAMNEINALRAENGADPVSLHDTAATAAQLRAQELAQSFTHTRPDGSLPTTALTELGITLSCVAENILLTALPDASLAVEYWKNSTGHFQNMINPEFQSMAIGCYYDENANSETPYCWCLFLFTEDDGSETPEISTEQKKTSLLEQINTLRKENNLPEFQTMPELSGVSDLRAEETVQEFSHSRPDGSSYTTALEEAGIPFVNSNELLAAGRSEAEEVLKQWLNQESSEKLLLSSAYSHIGIGCYADASAPYQYYWTLVFISSPGSNVQTMLDSINSQREENQLPALTLNEELNAAADVRVKELTESFSHTRPDGSNCLTALDSLSYQAGKKMEIFSSGNPDPAEVLEAWLDSKTHKEVILNPDYTNIGISFLSDPESEYQYYWEIWFTDGTAQSNSGELPGDADLSGKIDILDVITVNRAILGKETLDTQQLKNADVNHNSKPDAADSLQIMKYIVGLVTEF